jgi:3-phosphoshikimate 1-carboxyvinyltransferase
MLLEGNGKFKGGHFESFGDHRIAMAIAISSIVASGETEIDDHQVASVSYKNFWEDLFTISK